MITSENGTELLEADNGSFYYSPRDRIRMVPCSIQVVRNTCFTGEAAHLRNSLSNMYIPDSVQRIDSGTFQSMKNLQSLTLSSNLNSVAPSTFADCLKLSKIFFPTGLRYIEEYAFRNCQSLKEIHLKPGLLRIGHDAFAHCRNLKKIILPSNIERIDHRAFYGCNNIRHIVIDTESEIEFQRVQSLLPSTLRNKAISINRINRANNIIAHILLNQTDSISFPMRGGRYAPVFLNQEEFINTVSELRKERIFHKILSSTKERMKECIIPRTDTESAWREYTVNLHRLAIEIMMDELNLFRNEIISNIKSTIFFLGFDASLEQSLSLLEDLTINPNSTPDIFAESVQTLSALSEELNNKSQYYFDIAKKLLICSGVLAAFTLLVGIPLISISAIPIAIGATCTAISVAGTGASFFASKRVENIKRDNYRLGDAYTHPMAPLTKNDLLLG